MEFDKVTITKPDFLTPEVKKDAEFYANMARWVVAKGVNRKSQNLQEGISEFYEIVDNWRFYLGNQEIGIADALIGGYATKQMYREGLEINRLVNHKVGKVWELLQNAIPSAETINKEVKSRKLKRAEIMLGFLNNKEYFKSLQELGIMFNAVPDFLQIETQEDFEKKKEYTLKEMGEITIERIARWIFKHNDSVTMYAEGARQCIVGGYAAVLNQSIRGIGEKKLYGAHQAIYDNSQTNIYANEGRYGAVIDWEITPDEVISLYSDQLTPDEIDEIKKLNKGVDGFLQTYNQPINGVNFWCNPTSYVGLSDGTIVTVFMLGARDLRLKEDKNGIVVKMKDYDVNGKVVKWQSEQKGDYIDEVWYKAKLIYNKYVVDFGVCDSQVFDELNYKQPPCPLQFVIPSATMGTYKSDVSKVKPIQRQIDFITNKITDKLIRDRGKIYSINAKVFGIDDPAAFFTEVFTQNIHIATGDGVNPGNTKLSEGYIDLTLDKDVMNYVALKKEYISEMNDNLSMPDVLLGTQNITIGKSVQKETISAANTGLLPFFYSYLNFVQRDIELGANMMQLSWANGDISDDKMEEIVGVDGLNYLKITKKNLFSYYGIGLKIENILTSEARKELISEAMIALQSDPELLQYLVKLRTFTSITEAENYIDYVFKLKERKALAREKAIMEQKAAEVQQGNEAQVIKSANTSDATRYQADKRKEAVIESTDKLVAAKNHATDTQADVKIIESVNNKHNKNS